MGKDDDLQHAYAAGVLDSDGCITIKKRREARQKKGSRKTYYALFLVVAQSGGGDDAPAVIRFLHGRYGGSVQRRHDRRPDRQPMWHWAVSTMAAEKALRAIYPFLIGKKDQARIALEYRERGMGRGKEKMAQMYYWELRETKTYRERVSDNEQGVV